MVRGQQQAWLGNATSLGEISKEPVSRKRKEEGEENPKLLTLKSGYDVLLL